MEAIRSRLSVSGISSNIGVFKEPRGIIRLLQIIFAILAFATACNGRSSMSMNIGSQEDAIMASWSYPYKLTDSMIILSRNNTALSAISTGNDAKSAAEFFVFTGVTSMLLAFVGVFFYVLLDRQYHNNHLLPIADFIVTIIWTIFWIAGSSAWAQGVTSIRTQTSFENIRQRSVICLTSVKCDESYSGNYGNLIASVIFGYLNFILWAGSAWFVFKETTFFTVRTLQQQQQQQQQQQPEVQPNTFSDIGSPNMQQPYYARSPGTIS